MEEVGDDGVFGMGFGDGNDNENGDSYNKIVDCRVSERDGWLVGWLVGWGDNELVGDDGDSSENWTIDYVDGDGHGGYA